MPVTIYKIDASPPARAVLMMAEFLKLKYEPKEVDIKAGEQLTPEYLKKNPMHTVPLLEDGDFLLADSHAINTYLVSKYGGKQQSKLYPSDLTLRATIDQRLFFDNSILFPAGRAIVRAVLTENLVAPTPQQIENVNDAYEILDKYLQKTKFVACDHVTAADVSCVASVSSTAELVPVDQKYTKLNAWWNMLKKEDWYQKANLPGLAQFAEFLKSKMDENRNALQT